MRVVYIPGVGGGLHSSTYNALKEKYDDAVCIPYDIEDPVKSEKVIASTIQSLLKDYVLLVGNSLGGYWANMMSNRFEVPAILINPSLRPNPSLAKHGIDQSILDEYKPSEVTSVVRKTVILSKNDEVVDPNYSASQFENKAEIVWINAGHRLDSYEMLFKKIHEYENTIYEDITSDL